MAQPTRVALVSFTDPRRSDAEQARERYIAQRHQVLAEALAAAGLSVIDPMAKVKDPTDTAFGLRTTAEVLAAAGYLQTAGAECLVLGCWHWTEPMLPLALVRETDLPVILYAEDDPAWAGAVCLGAVGASLWEIGLNHHAASHARALGSHQKVVHWAAGVGAAVRLRRQALLLWGGSYCLGMEHLQDDIPALKARFVGDVITEDQYGLVRRAERILTDSSDQVEAMIAWLEQGGASIAYDDTALTPANLRRQVALYLAARQRLAELAGEQVAGVSVRCQPELSDDYGVTGCFLPAFLPFGSDAQGPQQAVPTVCEGDIKGLVTCTLLDQLSGDAPPLFGQLTYLGKDHLVISNCGGSSVYYAAGSMSAHEVLPRLSLAGQCRGAGGAAIGYRGQPGAVTLARLVRIRGRYLMQLAAGCSLEITPHLAKGLQWGRGCPQLALSLDVPRDLLVEALGGSHHCLIPGDYTAELEHACREADLPVLRLDSAESLAAFRP